MTVQEAQDKANILAQINLTIWSTSDKQELNSLRSKFKSIWQEIQSNGFKIRHKKELDPARGYRVPKFWVKYDGSKEFLSIVDNSDKRGNNKGDCTTRCICFCTGEDYLTIQKEQMANVARTKAGWNERLTWRSPKVWKQSLFNRGFCEIILPRRVSRKVFLKLFKDSGIDDGIIATRSSGHVAAIDMKSKKILDTWDSSGGRIRSILVPIVKKDMWTHKVNAILG